MTEKNLAHALLTKLEEHIGGHSFGASPAELYDPITYIMSLGGEAHSAPTLASGLWHVW